MIQLLWLPSTLISPLPSMSHFSDVFGLGEGQLWNSEAKRPHKSWQRARPLPPAPHETLSPQFPSWEFRDLRIQTEDSSFRPLQISEYTMQLHSSITVFVVIHPSRIFSPLLFARLTHNPSLRLSQGVINSGALPKFHEQAPRAPWPSACLIYHHIEVTRIGVYLLYQINRKRKAVTLQKWRNQTPPYPSHQRNGASNGESRNPTLLVIQCTEKGAASLLCCLCPKRATQCDDGETPGKSKLRDIWQNKRSVFKNVKVVKDKERLRNSSRLRRRKDMKTKCSVVLN